MNTQEIANFIRQKYGRLDYLLLTLVSCALLIEKHVDEESVPALQMVKETLKGLHDDLSDEEVTTVAVMMSEIEYLRTVDKPDET